MKPEEQLWLNTLVRGLCDSVGLTHPNFDISEWKIIKEAREWLGTEDFNTICSYLKLEPSYILKLHEKIKKQKKSSTDRVYSALYTRIRRLRVIDDYISS
jgi:hypothetical protein